MAAKGLLPEADGWFPEKITTQIDIIILGMHARKDNPELKKALEIGVPVLSYPEFLYQHSKDKIRVVVAGSHGKTTTTSMILHVLNALDLSTYDTDLRFDYLVGAQLEGFERMVQLSDAPVIIIEGDEYLSSPIDRRPKFLHYKPHLAIITGIAWDHINVFPEFEEYVRQFELLLDTIEKDGKVFYYAHDKHLQEMIPVSENVNAQQYEAFEFLIKDGKTYLSLDEERNVPLQIFGQHNLENLKAAYLVCKEIGVRDEDFFSSIERFSGAAKRLQLIEERTNSISFLDFAHAPSKVEATIKAFKAQYEDRSLVACVELHTFSSLNKKFLGEYRGTMSAADEAIVFYSEHTLKMKKLPMITAVDIKEAFGHPNLHVFTDSAELATHLKTGPWNNRNLLMMSSGTFGGMELKGIIG